MGCPVLKGVWWEEPCLRSQLYTQFVDFRDLWLGVTNIEDQHLAERFAFVAWSIWHTRNASRMKIPCSPYARLYQDSMDRLQEYQAAQTLDEPTDSPVLDQEIHQVPTKWSPPCSNIYKANFDGAVFQELQKAGVGVVIRNSNGEVIGALSESYFLPATVEDVEAIACRKAISFAINLGLENVVFEGDSETIIKALNSDFTCLTSFGHIIDDARTLALCFDTFSFMHVKRSGNAVADKLAKLAKYSHSQVWYDDIPYDVKQLALVDISFH